VSSSSTSGGKQGRFHGRHETGRTCAHPGCTAPGEFRAPLERPGSGVVPPAGPPRHQYLCLDHVREFNAGYNWFQGMTPEEVYAAQNPYPQWDRAAQAFAAGQRRGDAFDRVNDALGVLRWREGDGRAAAPARTPSGRVLSPAESKALKTLELTAAASLADIKAAYRRLARRFHPDSNGGDRSQEDALRAVVEAQDLLVASGAFA
jgi:hypothetical protein